MFRFFISWLFVLTLALSARAAEPWTAAADLYRAGEYAEAYRSAEAALAEHPGDANLIRLMGMCLLDAGHAAEALHVLWEGVQLHPDSVAMAYYLAQAYAYAGHVDDAIRLANQIILHAPDSEYARRCRGALPDLLAMQGQRGLQRTATDRFDFYVRAGWEQDDNVPARAKNDPDDSPTDSARWTGSLYAAWRILDQEAEKLPFTLGVSYAAYQSVHERKAFEAYDVGSHTGGAFFTRQGNLGRRVTFSRLAWSISSTELDGESFSEIQSASASLHVQMGPRWTLGVNGGYAWKDFAGEVEFPEYFERDGEEWSGGISSDHRFWNNRLILSLGYGYRESDSEGSQFRSGSHNGNVSASLQLPGTFRLTAGLDYQQTHYADFLPDPARLDDLWTGTLSLVRPFADYRYNLELNLSHSAAESNREFAEYEQTVYGVAVSLNF